MIGHFARSLLQQLRQTQFLPPRALLAHQHRLLEPLVRHARAHVPFYRDSDRLDVLFRRDGTIAWEHWPDVPLLTRADIQRAGPALRSDAFDGVSYPLSTSGSTGEPVEVWHSELSDKVVRTAVILRDCESHEVVPTDRLLFLGVTSPNGAHGQLSAGVRRQDAWYAGLALLGVMGERFDAVDSLPPSTLIDIAETVAPVYLGAHPVTLELMAAHDRSHRLRALGLKAAFATGGGFSDGARPDVEHALGCRIMRIYGSNECGRMARSCVECGRYHCHSDVVRLEVIGDGGEDVQPGESGWVVATPLYNYAMPLIRYHHEDQAVVGHPHRCRILLPALDDVMGKQQAPFVFPGGLALRPKVPTSAVVEYLGAQAFRISQLTPERCLLEYVPGRLSPAERRFDALTTLLQTLWWPSLQLDYQVVETLRPPGPSPKVASLRLTSPVATRRGEPALRAQRPEPADGRSFPHGPGGLGGRDD